MDGDLDDATSTSKTIEQLNKVFDRMLASDDACTILSQKAARGARLSPTALSDTRARQTLALGIIKVYNHVVTLVPSPEVKKALVSQRDTFSEILDIVDHYATNPLSAQARTQIDALMKGQEYHSADGVVTAG
ncbi:MAG: hypothetical protein R2698_14265 [Microthrixaceae bacterium]